jgi:TrmH family RNA methyltransferase
MAEMKKIHRTIESFMEAHGDRFNPLGQKNETARRIHRLYGGKDEYIVLHGIWAHEKAHAAGLEVHSFLLCPTLVKWPKAAEMAEAFVHKAKECYTISERTFARITDYGDPDGILSLVTLPERTPESYISKPDDTVFVLDGLVKPGNVGVILRSCDGAGIDAVFTCNLRTRVTHPGAVKASMGAVFSLPIVPFGGAEECKDWLVRNGYTIYIADPKVDTPYNGFDFKGKTAVVMGNEHIGAKKIWYSGFAKAFAIPMKGTCDSLNVSVAASVLAYEVLGKKGKTVP